METLGTTSSLLKSMAISRRGLMCISYSYSKLIVRNIDKLKNPNWQEADK